MSDQSLRDALEDLQDDYTLHEIVTEALKDAEWCCPVGCGSGACESCPCCCAGYCVSGRDGIPNDDPDALGFWLEIASKHNPAIAQLRLLLAAHPAEPASVQQPSDAAVEAAAKAIWLVPPVREGRATWEVWNENNPRGPEKLRAQARAALEAAYRVDAATPEVGVMHVQHADAEEYARIYNLGFAAAVEQYADPQRLEDGEDSEVSGDAGPCCLQVGTCELLNVAISRSDVPRPLLDPEKLKRAIQEELIERGAGGVADAVMELARPMTTGDALDALLWQHRTVASNGTQTVCACDRVWRSDTEHRTHQRNAVLALLNGDEA